MRKIYSTLFIIYILSCNINAQKIELYNYKNLYFIKTTSKIVETNTNFTQLSDLYFFDQFVVTSDKSNSPTLQLLKRIKSDKFKYIKGTGENGRGPGEFADVWEIFGNYDNSKIFLFDAINRRIASYNSKLEVNYNDYIYIKSSGYFTSIFQDNELFYASGLAIGCQIEVINNQGETIRCLGKEPDLQLNSKYNIRSSSQRWHSYVVRNTKTGNYAIFYRHAIRASLLDKNGELIKELINKYYGIPSTQIINGNALPTNSDMRAYISATSNNEYIYALFSGNISESPTSSLGSYIHIFDWNLNLIKILELDHLSINLILDPKTNKLYSIEWEPESNIRLIDL